MKHFPWLDAEHARASDWRNEPEPEVCDDCGCGRGRCRCDKREDEEIDRRRDREAMEGDE